jgi:hypothetical protein
MTVDSPTGTEAQPAPSRGTLGGARVLCVIVAVLLVTASLFAGEVQAILLVPGTGPRALAWAAASVLMALAICLPRVAGWLGKTAIRRVGALVIVCAVLGATLFFAIALVAQDDAYKILLLRCVFLLVAALLPAILYWMFIATRKSSLFYEFLSNMNRLGLFSPRLWPPDEPGGAPREESEAERRRRVAGYLHRFEASFGPLPASTRDRLVRNQDLPLDLDSAAEQTRVPLWSLLSSETVVPVVVLTGLVTFLWFPILLGEFLISSPPRPDLLPHDPLWVRLSPMLAAFLGAYFFCLQSLFRRYIRKDLRPAAYVAATQRIVLATVGTWVLHSIVALVDTVTPGEFGQRDVLIVLGFAAGVFPGIVWQYVQAAVKKVLPTSSVLPSLDSPMPISDLDGLTVWHEARLEEEDVENLPNMATADLLDLMLGTKIPPDRLIDWADQAILLTQLGRDDPGPAGLRRRDLLRAHGVRTATGLAEAHRRSDGRGAAAQFETILPGGPPSPVRGIIDSLETVPNLKLIRKWRGLIAPGDVEPVGSANGTSAAAAGHYRQGSSRL